MSDFHGFGLEPSVVEAIDAMGYTSATPIQKDAIPVILKLGDIIGCAQTGTGKTAAFLIPVINNIIKKPKGGIRCLIVAPTRELAVQIEQQITGLAYFCPVSSYPVYGGTNSVEFSVQQKAIQTGADILVATPGRLLAHLNLGYVEMNNLDTLILDEADRMLDMGFVEDIMRIVKYLPEVRQTLMFSATMAPEIRKFAQKILKDPIEVSVAISTPTERVTQSPYLVHNADKIKLLEHLFSKKEIKNIIIFASRKSSVDEIHRTLNKLNYNVEKVHSGKEQKDREETLRNFKAGNFNILVATDVLSRGIDIEGLSHVLNFDIPPDAEDYVHRIGRTARAEMEGEAISFINIDDQKKFQRIERLIGKDIEKLTIPESIGRSPDYNPNRRGSGRSNNYRGKGGKPFRKKNFKPRNKNR